MGQYLFSSESSFFDGLFDLFDKAMWNWKGQSGNSMMITMLTMLIPAILVLILYGVFGK
ncbi:MAG: hypothetical protein LBB73_05330 [Dysgonamonadaceae bacterium]|nr:hypothetical protein [Dysgonamonadaceae bacterium]